MFRIFKSLKPVPLGRWNTDKPVDATLRLIDLANCDSCGTCTVPEKKPTVVQKKLLGMPVLISRIITQKHFQLNIFYHYPNFIMTIILAI